MDLVPVLTAFISLFVIIGIGYVLRKRDILDGGKVKTLSHILVSIALPALTISSMQVPLSAETLGIARSMLLIAFAYYLAAFGVGYLICRFLPASDAERGIFRFMLVFPNVGFMGIPVSLAFLGPGSLFYVILFCLPFHLFVFTLGVYLVANGRPGTFSPRVLLTPGLVAALIGLALFVTGLSLPAPVNTALGWIGMAVTPLAMLVVGAHLAMITVSHLAGDYRIAIISALRLVVFPLLAFIILIPFIPDRLILSVTVLLIGMPVAANAVLFAEEYGVDATPASQGVFATTLCCIATIPLLMMVLF